MGPKLLAFAVVLALAIALVGANTMKVLKSNLPLDQRKKAISGAKLLDDRTISINDFSFCIRFYLQVLHRSGQGIETLARVVSIEDWKDAKEDPLEMQLLWFVANHPNSFLGFGHPNAGGSYKSWLIRDPDTDSVEVWGTNRWSHMCFSYEKQKAFVKFAKDGRIMNMNNTDPNVANVQIPEDFLQKIYIGRCGFDYHKRCSAVGGRFTDFNVWDRPLTDKEMEDFTSCGDMNLKGNVVNWNSAEFDLENMTLVDETISSVCEPLRPGDVLFMERRNFTAHRAMCNKMRGQVSVVDSQATQTAFLADVEEKNYQPCIDGRNLWTGYWDVPEEGVFSSGSDQSLKLGSFQPWAAGEPNGARLENCAALVRLDQNWLDYGCDNTICGACNLEFEPVLNIRGLCLGSLFDRKYSWTRAIINDRFAFFGITDTVLYYMPDKKEWKLELYSNNETYAVTRSEDYPFGTKEWTIYQEPCYVDKDENVLPEVKVFLNLNNCDVDEFNCRDGSCIPMGKRCDGRVHCPDRSDEIGCQIFSTDASYLKFMPPAGETDETLFPVDISVEVLNVLDISEVENYINLQLRIYLTWKDDRLTMTNLKLDSDLNSLTQAQRSDLWLPEIVFFNTDQKFESVNDEKASATIERHGEFEQERTSAVLNGYTFQGGDNPITLSRVYSFKYLCEFYMGDYPFDAQNCSATFVMKGNSGKFVKLLPKQLEYIGPVDLTQYFVHKYRINETEVLPGIFGVKVELVFARRLLSTILTTYLPTMLICLVSFTTNFYKGFFFEAIVTVNLTSLLLLVTLFISVSDSLPKTAYVKLIDVWLIFILFIPFSEVFIHTIIDNLRTDERRDINHHGMPTVVSDNDPDLFKNRLFDQIFKPNEETNNDTNGNPEGPRRNQVSTDTQTNLVTVLKANKEQRAWQKQERKRKQSLKVALFIARFGMPSLFVAFCVIYFTYGTIMYQDITRD